MTSKDKEQESAKRKRDDSAFEDLFDSFKQSVVLLVMIIVYNAIPTGIGYLGYYLATKGGVDFSELISNPSSLLHQQIHYGLYIIGVAAILFIVGFAAAFIFTASRNDRIAKPLSFMKAYIDTWGILLQFAIILAIFGGLYFGISYLNNDIATLIVGIISAIVAALSPLAMIFKTIDFLLELE